MSSLALPFVVGAVGAGVAAVIWGLTSLAARRRNRAHGSLVGADRPSGSGPVFQSKMIASVAISRNAVNALGTAYAARAVH